MPICLFHNIKACCEKIFRHRLVEEVRHAIDEYFAGTLPLEWKFNRSWVKRELEAALVLSVSHLPKPLRESFSIAVLATRGDLGTSRRGIPGRIRPLNWRFVTQVGQLPTKSCLLSHNPRRILPATATVGETDIPAHAEA